MGKSKFVTKRIQKFPGQDAIRNFSGDLEHQMRDGWGKTTSLTGLRPFDELILCAIESDNADVAGRTLEAATEVLFMMLDVPENQDPFKQTIINQLNGKVGELLEVLV